jgi:hypothetical protein
VRWWTSCSTIPRWWKFFAMDRMLFWLSDLTGALCRRRLKAGTVDAILDWILEKKYDGTVLSCSSFA